ncbi:hypothetical protein ACO1PF_05250 [Alkalibacterium sp. f15]|uniref:hypothetical protein n=1 Tax=Alkalibacterium sp. f15 TaxID=3414029 RepID=UPI003BF87DE9
MAFLSYIGTSNDYVDVYGTYEIAEIDDLEEGIEKYQRIIVPGIFIGAGFLNFY